MEHVDRILDSCAASLRERVERALADRGGDCAVEHFTYWYTGRPPVHEALIVRRSGDR